MAKCRGGSGRRRWRRGSAAKIASRTAPLSPRWATGRSGTSSWARNQKPGSDPVGTEQTLARFHLGGLRGGGLPFHVLAVQADEIDRIEHQRREAAVAHRGGDDLAREWE